MVKALALPKLPDVFVPSRQTSTIDVEVEYSDEFPFKVILNGHRTALTYQEADKLRSYLQAMLQDYDMVKEENND